MAETGRDGDEARDAGTDLPPAGLVSQMLAPELVEAPAPGRRRAAAEHDYAAGLRLGVRRMPPGWRRSVSA
jgi:hypothetical protein